MNKAPLLVVDGKIGRFGGAVKTKFEGVGALKKSGGLYMFQASLTATQAHKLEAMAKRVPAEVEARTRAKAGVVPYEGRDGAAMLPRHTGSKVDPIRLTSAGEDQAMTYPGHAYMQERQTNPAFTPEQQGVARRLMREEGDRLVDLHAPKRPEQRDGEPDASYDRRLATYERAKRRRQDRVLESFDIREPEALDYERLVAMLRADPGKRAEIDRAIAKNGRWVWKFDNPELGWVEYIEFDSMYEVDEAMKDDPPVEDPDLADVEAALLAPGPRGPDPAVVADRLAGTTRRVRLRRPARRLPGPATPVPPPPRGAPAGLPPPASPASPPAAAPAASAADERNRQMLRAMLGAMDPASRAAALAEIGKGRGKAKILQEKCNT